MFDNPSVAQQVSNTVRRIVGDTERIRENTGKISRAAMNMARSFANMVNSTSAVSANLNAMVSQLQSSNTASRNLNRNLGGSATATNTAVVNTTRLNTNLNRNNAAASTMLNRFTAIQRIISAGIITGLSAVVIAMTRIQQQGAAFKQVLDVTVDSIKNLGQVFRTGVVAGVSDLALAQISLGRNLGGLNRVTKDLIESTVELSNVYNVSEQNAAKINSQLFRWTGRSGQLVKNTQQYVVALAKANSQLPGDVIEQMAQNTDELARFANQGAEGFARQLVVLNKMGVSMKSISGLADRLVTDFEGTLQSAAKLQTFMPGFDISGVQFAAQFGTNEQVAVELQTALQRSGISSLSQLPRSLQNAIGSSLGMSLTEVQNLLTNTLTETQVNQVTAEHFDTKIDKLINSGINTANDIVNTLRQGFNSILAFLLGRESLRGIRGVGGTATRIGRTAGRMMPFVRGMGAPLLGAGLSLATGGGAGGALGSLTGGLAGGALGSFFGPGGTVAGSIIGSVIGEYLGRSIPKLIKSSQDLAEKNSKAAKIQESNTNAVEKSTKAVNDIALRQAAAAAGVKDFNFAMQQFQRQSSGLGSVSSTSSTGGWSWFKSKFSGFFHDGGVVGDNMVGRGNTISDLKNLKPQETIAILQKGEVVLTAAQMKNIGRALGSVMRSNLSSAVGGLFSTFNMGLSQIGQNFRSIFTGQGSILGTLGGLFGGSKQGGIFSNISSIGSSLFKGGLSKLGGAKIGAALGSIVPGAGTLLGGLLGGGLGALTNTGIGKTITGLISKSPIGKVGGSIVKGVGKVFGGLFGKKKKPSPPKISSPFDLGSITGIAGLMGLNTQGLSNIFSIFGGAGDGGLGARVSGISSMMSVSGGTPQVTLNTVNLENKIDQLINLMRSGGIAVNLDGRKVSSGLMEANRYG